MTEPPATAGTPDMAANAGTSGVAANVGAGGVAANVGAGGVAAVAGAVWRQESARIVGGLLRMVHDVGLAEEFAQDALVAALERWPVDGVPDSPGAWLMTIAKRRAVDHLRRTTRLEPLAQSPEQAPEPAGDDVLRLMFTACHPVLQPEARVALTLRVVAGLSTTEIGRAFLVAEPVIVRRIAGAKRTLAEAGVAYEPSAALASVLEVVYLIFNEGYSATSGDDLIRADLCLEALRLGRLLAGLAPDQAEAHGLVALMEIQQSRSAARTGPAGEPVQLHEQNRGRWDQLLIRRGFAAMLRAREAGGPAGPYVLQAAIAVCHAQARTAEETDWARIASLYDALVRLMPTPVVRLNRAVAVGFARGPQAGLDLIDELRADARLTDYHLLPSVRGDLLRRLGRLAEARHELERAAGLTANTAEREFLLARAAVLPEVGGRSLGEATAEFLGSPGVSSPATARAYGQTLSRIARVLGERTPLSELTGARVHEACQVLWADAMPRGWNRHVAALRSFAAWADVTEISGMLQPLPVTSTPAAGSATWTDSAPLRERTLWTMVRESSAPITAILALDVQDLDLDDRRAITGVVSWRSATARLLTELVADRTHGPVFLSERRPGPGRPAATRDLCPVTGRRRLSYERAEYLCKQATGGTLRRLRA
ncbi:putative RNA polymerase sigma factor [Actinoplanes lutulentus]|uniref:Putative RNA polymerase sigma factor n=1 Tax=Actinoplanes lutulentus TaxID=1287878 RepID=A0A327ZIR2_9ACTN|nr:DUF6596 domain-containing protein [Actinoplanes lutulentus]MBB2942522.1 putative RNA polymerase sigma factor [Actinoplanes lutulentus]RAK38103.1 putative RNA polymerase sigma factor [Actinoplanes lutulentus]